MPKNQNKPKAKKYRRDRNHAESLENIDFFSIIKIKSIILVYYPLAFGVGFWLRLFKSAFCYSAGQSGHRTDFLIAEINFNCVVACRQGAYRVAERRLIGVFAVAVKHQVNIIQR